MAGLGTELLCSAEVRCVDERHFIARSTSDAAAHFGGMDPGPPFKRRQKLSWQPGLASSESLGFVNASAPLSQAHSSILCLQKFAEG